MFLWFKVKLYIQITLLSYQSTYKSTYHDWYPEERTFFVLPRPLLQSALPSIMLVTDSLYQYVSQIWLPSDSIFLCYHSPNPYFVSSRMISVSFTKDQASISIQRCLFLLWYLHICKTFFFCSTTSVIVAIIIHII